MNEYLCQELCLVGVGKQRFNLRTLCEAQSRILAYRHHLLRDQRCRRQKWSNGDFSLGEQLTAAISVQAYELIGKLLPQTSTHSFDILPARSPLSIVLHLKDDNLLSLALDNVPSMKARNPDLSVEDIVAFNAMNQAIQRQSTARAFSKLS